MPAWARFGGIPATKRREAIWGAENTTGLEAEVLLDGDLVAFVPQIPGSENFDEAQIVDAIARADYDQPEGRERAEAPPAGPRGRRLPPLHRRLPLRLRVRGRPQAAPRPDTPPRSRRPDNPPAARPPPGPGRPRLDRVFAGVVT